MSSRKLTREEEEAMVMKPYRDTFSGLLCRLIVVLTAVNLGPTLTPQLAWLNVSWKVIGLTIVAIRPIAMLFDRATSFGAMGLAFGSRLPILSSLIQINCK